MWYHATAVSIVVILFAALCPLARAQNCTSAPHVPIAKETTPEQLIPLIAQMRNFPTDLNPRIFSGGRLKPAVRNRTMEIVDRLFQRLKKTLPTVIGADEVSWDVGAVELLGSEAGYEYDAMTDLGIHVFLSTNGTICTNVTEKVSKREVIDCDACPAACIADPIVKLFNPLVEFEQEPSDLSDAGSGIMFFGMPVEVTFHSTRGPSYQVYPDRGHWSVSDDTWINKAEPQQDLTDPAQMLADAMLYIKRYNELACDYIESPEGFDCDLFDELDSDLGEYRDNGIAAAGNNTRNTANITYRLLRRLPSVNIPDIVDVLQLRCFHINSSLRDATDGPVTP